MDEEEPEGVESFNVLEGKSISPIFGSSVGITE